MPAANRLTAAVLLAIALIAFVNTRQFSLGTFEEPGPGLFPRLLAGLLAALSMPLISRKGASANDGDFLRLLRPSLAIFAAALVFAATIQGFSFARSGIGVPALGMPAAGTLALLVSGLAEKRTRWAQLVILASLLPLGFSVILRFALGQPVALAPWLLGY
jgi:Tripartite tricarboxylate transporter TctB family